MLTVCSAVSGEVLAALDADEVECKTVKLLKTHVAKQIGATRFQQKWFDDQNELDDEAVPPPNVQLVILDHWHHEEGQAEQMIAACAENRWGELEVLLQKPLNPDVTDESGQAAIHAAALAGSEQCLVLLLEAGAANDKVRNDGMTALALAARNGHPKVSQLLLEAGADKDRATQSGRTALHFAVEFGHPEVARLLLEIGADKKKVTANGRRVLDLAASNGHSDVVRLLLETGVVEENLTPAEEFCFFLALESARSNGHQEVVKLLWQHSARAKEKSRDPQP